MKIKADLVAGLTLAAYLLPAGIGDASLAGLPAETGYTRVSSPDWCSGSSAARGTPS